MNMQDKELRVVHPKETPYRFVIFTVYFCTAIVNSLPVHTFSSINTLISKKFNINSSEITLNALMFTIAHPLFAVPCNWILERYGMRIGFIIGGFLVVGGVWLRILIAEERILFCLMGSVLAALGNIFILNSPSKMAANWFKTESIPNTVFLAVLANLISITLGASVPGLVLTENSTQDNITFFLQLQAIVVTIPYILLTIFFRQRPQIPPSKAAANSSKAKHDNYAQMLKSLFSNKQYLKMIVAMSFNYGTLTAFLATLDQILKVLQYTQPGKIAAFCFISAMLVGILGNPIFSNILKRSHAYKAVTLFCAFGGFISICLLQLLFIQRISASYMIIIYAGIAGFFVIPIPSLCISFASELVFPLDEGSSTGYLFAGSQTFGFVIGAIITVIVEQAESMAYFALALYAFLQLLACIVVLATQEDLRRLKFQTEYESPTNSGLDDSLVVKQPGETSESRHII